MKHRIRSSFLVALLVVTSACASLPAKQKAVAGLQSVETALGAAQDFERANHTALGLDSVAPDTQRALCPSSALPAPLPANATKHQVVSCLFVQAFASQIQSGVALQTWTAGAAAPTPIAELKGEVDAIFGIAKGLSVNANQQAFLGNLQTAVDTVLAVVTMVGGAR